MLDLHDSLDRHKAGSKAKIANVEGNKEMFRGTDLGSISSKFALLCLAERNHWVMIRNHREDDLSLNFPGLELEKGINGY